MRPDLKNRRVYRKYFEPTMYLGDRFNFPIIITAKKINTGAQTRKNSHTGASTSNHLSRNYRVNSIRYRINSTRYRTSCHFRYRIIPALKSMSFTLWSSIYNFYYRERRKKEKECQRTDLKKYRHGDDTN